MSNEDVVSLNTYTFYLHFPVSLTITRWLLIKKIDSAAFKRQSQRNLYSKIVQATQRKQNEMSFYTVNISKFAYIKSNTQGHAKSNQAK